MMEIRIHGRGGQGAVTAAKILGEAAKIHGDLQQLSTGQNEDIQAEIGSALDELTVIRAALLKGLGRNP